MATLSSVLVWLERRIPGAADKIRMIDAINIALSELGPITKVDTSLTVVENQTEYDLPANVDDVVRVQVGNDSTPDYYYTLYNWREDNGVLYFRKKINATAGIAIRLFYNDEIDAVADDEDTISDVVPTNLLVATAAYHYYRLQYDNRFNKSIKEDSTLQMLLRDMQNAQMRQSVKRMPRDPILGGD